MPFGLTSGSPTPSSGGSQSRCDRIVSCRRTTASLRGTPTLNWTVTIACPGRDTDHTCSRPWICDSTCSAGMATSCSTSAADAPGNGTRTLAIVTSICGSSSRGVTATANRPSISAINATSGVSRECRKKPAMRPEMPMAATGYGAAERPAATGLAAMRSPARSPDRISITPPSFGSTSVSPVRTWRSSARPSLSST